jgi:hypothetical protein
MAARPNEENLADAIRAAQAGGTGRWKICPAGQSATTTAGTCARCCFMIAVSLTWLARVWRSAPVHRVEAGTPLEGDANPCAVN